MIDTKEKLKIYLLEDKRKYIGGGRNLRRPRIFADEIWKFLINLRKLEYIINVSNNKLMYLWRKYRHHKLSIYLGINISPNTCKEGLRIQHYGGINVNPNAIIGKNVTINQNVTIGNNGKVDGWPIIGDNVYIGANTVIIGNVKIGDNVTIGAGTVVTKNVPTGSTVVGHNRIINIDK